MPSRSGVPGICLGVAPVREDHAVVGHALSARQRDLPRRGVEPGRRLPEPDVEVEVVVLGGLAEVDVVVLELPTEHSFRQRRTVVGQMVLRPDERHRAVEAAGAERLGRPQARE